MSCLVRSMRKDDIDQVNEIDREAFPSMWPPVNFDRELRNQLAYYIVVYDDEKTCSRPVKARRNKTSSGVFPRIRRWLSRNNTAVKEEPAPSVTQFIRGFAGFWLVADEAHIMNIAVREQYRRQGTGELLLISLIDLALELKADFITLEVRPSNNIAQSLYSKYGFARVGERRGYYSDNKEDAIIMSTETISSASFRERHQRLKEDYFKKQQIAPDRIGCLPGSGQAQPTA